MKNNCLLSTINALVLAVALCSVALAQTSPQKSAPSSASLDSHDLTGVWLQQGGGGGANEQGHLSAWVDKTNPTLTPEGMKLMAEHKPSRGPRTVMPALQNDPQGGGNPPGLIRTFIYARPFENIKLPDSMVTIIEWYHMWRQIWTDGRKLPAWDSIGPYWYGYSVGSFKGNEFEVQTESLDNRAWLDDWGTPFSESLHLTEHWNRVDHDTLKLRLTIDDPMTYTQPWTTKELTYKYQPKSSKDGELFEVIFAPIDEQEFNKNLRDKGAYSTTKK